MTDTDRAHLSRNLTLRIAAASDEGVFVEMLYLAVSLRPEQLRRSAPSLRNRGWRDMAEDGVGQAMTA
jgi:hypothetical protein